MLLKPAQSGKNNQLNWPFEPKRSDRRYKTIFGRFRTEPKGFVPESTGSVQHTYGAIIGADFKFF
jgi:hypothetical protein